MKYIIKIPEENKKYTEELINSGWKRLKEPKDIHLTMLLSLPIGLFLAILTIYYYSFFYNPFQKLSNGGLSFTLNFFDLVLLCLTFLIFFITHEFIHLIFIPNFLYSEKTYWGMRWTYFFVLSEEEMFKNRIIVVFIMPLIILSVIFPLILNVFGWFNLFWWFLCLFNAVGSCVDILSAFLITFQVPKGGIVKNNGRATFYKK